MSSFAVFTKEILRSNEEYLRQPKMIQDMLQVHANLRDCKEFNQLQSPILTVTGGCNYTEQDIVLGLQILKSKGYSSFVFAESSTYCLKLLHDILHTASKYQECPSCSISGTYDKEITTRWGDKRVISGVVIKLTEKKAERSLPGNVIR